MNTSKTLFILSLFFCMLLLGNVPQSTAYETQTSCEFWQYSAWDGFWSGGRTGGWHSGNLHLTFDATQIPEGANTLVLQFWQMYDGETYSDPWDISLVRLYYGDADLGWHFVGQGVQNFDAGMKGTGSNVIFYLNFSVLTSLIFTLWLTDDDDLLGECFIQIQISNNVFVENPSNDHNDYHDANWLLAQGVDPTGDLDSDGTPNYQDDDINGNNIENCVDSYPFLVAYTEAQAFSWFEWFLDNIWYPYQFWIIAAVVLFAVYMIAFRKPSLEKQILKKAIEKM